MNKTHLDLFTGIGGFALAARWAGYTTIGFSEIEPYCCELIAQNFPGVPNLGDIRKITKEMLEYFLDGNIIEPCQSNAPIAEKEKPRKAEVIAVPAEQLELLDGGLGIGSVTEAIKDHGAAERSLRSFNPTGECALVAAKPNANFLRSTISMEAGMRIEGNINPKPGSLLSKEKSRRDFKFSAITATTQKLISEYAPTKIDLLTAGIPCQPASCAGKRRGKKDDRWLWPETLTIIGWVKPSFCILENPPGIITLNGGVEFEAVLSHLESIGYATQPIVIPACAADAPHIRNRVWILAHAQGERSRETREFLQRPEERITQCGEVPANRIGAGLEERQEQSTREERQAVKRDGHNVANASPARQWRKPRKGETERTSISDADIKRCFPQENPIRAGRDSAEYGCQWEAEPELGRVAHGISNRVDRLKGLGNSIVPQVAFQIIKVISEES